jgi:hypothetical protein
MMADLTCPNMQKNNGLLVCREPALHRWGWDGGYWTAMAWGLNKIPISTAIPIGTVTCHPAGIMATMMILRTIIRRRQIMHQMAFRRQERRQALQSVPANPGGERQFRRQRKVPKHPSGTMYPGSLLTTLESLPMSH